MLFSIIGPLLCLIDGTSPVPCSTSLALFPALFPALFDTDDDPDDDHGSIGFIFDLFVCRKHDRSIAALIIYLLLFIQIGNAPINLQICLIHD